MLSSPMLIRCAVALLEQWCAFPGTTHNGVLGSCRESGESRQLAYSPSGVDVVGRLGSAHEDGRRNQRCGRGIVEPHTGIPKEPRGVLSGKDACVRRTAGAKHNQQGLSEGVGHRDLAAVVRWKAVPQCKLDWSRRRAPRRRRPARCAAG